VCAATEISSLSTVKAQHQVVTCKGAKAAKGASQSTPDPPSAGTMLLSACFLPVARKQSMETEHSDFVDSSFTAPPNVRTDEERMSPEVQIA